MLQSIQKFLERFSQLLADRPFFCGFLLGLAVAIAVLLFLLLFSLIFRSRKLRCIVIPSEDGDLRIDSKAVQGAIRALAANYPAFRIRSIGLYGKSTAFELLIEMDFNGGDASLSVLAEKFRAAVARMMTDMFGVEKPARIELEILRSSAELPAIADTGDGDGDVEAEETPVDSGSC